MASSHAGAMAAAESSLEAQKDSFADLGFEANAFETLERDFQEVLTELVRRPAAPTARGPAVVALTRHLDRGGRPSSANAACDAPTLAPGGGRAARVPAHDEHAQPIAAFAASASRKGLPMHRRSRGG